MGDNRSCVALLVDFENLAYGLREVHGETFPEELEPDLLLKLAEEYGQVVLANAYADWRSRDVNQFQVDLYRLGIDLVHVVAKSSGGKFKNAVDVKMAVDAIESIWTLPHVETFVIVSGDRDFIPVLKTLRRHGKAVVGVSPAKSVSDDFAALCDRFVRYGALASTYGQSARLMETAAALKTRSAPGGLNSVRAALREIVSDRRDGIKGSQVKPMLRRKLSPTFDESEYGFSRLSELLLAMPDIVKVVFNPMGGDITVLPADSDVSPAGMADQTRQESDETLLLRQAGITSYRYSIDPGVRRAILTAFFDAIKQQEPFTMSEVFETLLEEQEGLHLSVSMLSKYHAVLWQSRTFEVEPDQQALPTRQRLMRLEASITSADKLIERYEASIAYKLNAAAQESNRSLDKETLCRVLGLEETEEHYAYCTGLLSYATQQA